MIFNEKRLLILVVMFVISILNSCSSNEPGPKNLAEWNNALINYKSSEYKGKITEMKWRNLEIEATVSISVNPEARSGKDFNKVLEMTREIFAQKWIERFPNYDPPLINILVYDSDQLVYVDAAGTGHFVAIALNLPIDKPSFVNFSADWCEKGHAVDQAMNEVNAELEGAVHFETVDTDKETGLTEMANITEIPSQMIFDASGNLVILSPDEMNKKEILDHLESILGKM